MSTFNVICTLLLAEWWAELRSFVVDSMICRHHIYKVNLDAVDWVELTCSVSVKSSQPPYLLTWWRHIVKKTILLDIYLVEYLLLEAQSLDGFSLARLCSFSNFAKPSPTKHSHYMVHIWYKLTYIKCTRCSKSMFNSRHRLH